MSNASETTGRLRVDADETLAAEIHEVLVAEGFRYEEDFECLYGARWKITGVMITANHADVVAALDAAGLLEG